MSERYEMTRQLLGIKLQILLIGFLFLSYTHETRHRSMIDILVPASKINSTAIV